MAGPFDEYLKDLKARTAQKTAMQVDLVPETPEKVAETLATAKELNVPPGRVALFSDEYKAEVQRKRNEAALVDAPKMSDWLRSDPTNAALAKDDLDNLSWFERGLKNFSLIGQDVNESQVGRGFRTGITGAQQMGTAAATVPLAGAQATLLKRLDSFERAKNLPLDMPRHEVAEALGLDPMSPSAAMAADFLTADEDRRKWYVDRTIEAVTGNKELMESLTQSVKGFEEQMKATQGRTPNFTDIDDVNAFADWAGFNLGQAAPYLLATAAAGLVGGVPGVAAAGYGMGVGDIRSEQLTSGQDPNDLRAAGAAALGGVPYAGMELLGPAAWGARGVRSKAGSWLGQLWRGVRDGSVEEFINEFGQEAIKDYAVAAGGGAPVKLDNETLLKWFNSGMAGLVSGGAMSGGMTAADIMTDRAQTAGGTAEMLDTVSQQAQQSRVRERSPERFKQALDQSMGDQAVYVPAQGLREFFQARDTDFDAAMAEAWGIDPDTLSEMALSGGRVAVPLSNFAANLAGTDAEAWIRENATSDPDEFSIADAQGYQDLVSDDLAEQYERDLAEMRARDAERSSDEQVFDGIYSQLRAAGRTVDVAQKEALVMGAFFRTMGQRTGEDSLELAQRFGLRIQGPDAPGVPRRRGNLDIMLNDLRSGRKEKTGRNLTQFVIDEGGIQDTGGDVGEIEGPKGLVKETAEEIRARRASPTMFGLPAQGRGLQLDEMGRKAVEAGYFPELMGEVQGLNDGEAADLGAALLEALREEASGNLRYVEGDGPDPARAALNDALQRLGIDPAAMTNDEIAAALEGDTEGRGYGQGPASVAELEAAAKDAGVDLSLSERDGRVTVHKIVASKKGEGAGSKVMQAIADYADLTGQKVALTPSADFGGSVSRLRKFYKRHGFVENKGKNRDFETRETLIREPQREYGKGGRTIEVDGFELPLNPDGTVTLYHGTTKDGAKSIIDSKTLRAEAEPSVYLTSEISGDLTGYGDGTVVAVDVRPSQLRIDDEFPDGRADFAIDKPTARIVRARVVDPSSREFNQSAATNTDSPAFKEWFGDSKVVNPDGSPMVVYHGGAAGIEEFGGGAAARVASIDPNNPAAGVSPAFFSSSETVAESYRPRAAVRSIRDGRGGDTATYPVYLSLQNPIEIDMAGGRFDSDNRADIIRQIIEAGADGAIIRNVVDDAGQSAAPSDVFITTKPEQIKSVNNRGTFNPNDPRILNQERRGSIVFPSAGPDGAETVINLFENADLSTFMHEAGHFFLETFDAIASDPDAPQQVKDDMAAVREYLGADPGAPFTEAQHETFARTAEAYFMEGKSPSLALADVFARMKAWLTRIYRTVAGLNVPINDEIRAVFDRMIATDAEIAQTRAEMAAGPLFREAPPGMSPGDWQTYQRLARRSAEQAEAKLRERTMERVRREREKWWKDERKQVVKEETTRMQALPQYRLISAMANGQIIEPDGKVTEAPDVRMDRQALIDQFGDGVIAELSRSKFGGNRAIYGADGISPGEAAEMFGFANSSTMIQILQNTTKLKDAVNAEADRVMLERYGDALHDGSIEAEAMDAIHNEQQAQANVAEARHMAGQMKRDTRNMTARAYRQRAQLMLGRMTVKEATNSSQFLASERRAAMDAQRAFAKVARGNAAALPEALQAKEQQILNGQLYNLSRQAADRVNKAREKMRDYGKKDVRAKLAGGYIEQIDALLDRFDFRKLSEGQVKRTENLRDFVGRMEAEGRASELTIDERLLNETKRKHYTRLSLDELDGLLDTVANIDHMGRFKKKLLDAKKKRDLDETAEKVATGIEDNIGSGRIKKESRVRSVLDLIFTADTVMTEIDGGDEFGAAYQNIKQDIDAGYVNVSEMNRELSVKLDDLFGVYSAKEMRDMKKERHINGTRFSWPKWKAIAVALNTGNADNVARLLSRDAHPDQRLTPEDLTAILSTLDKRDWDFVQSMWDLIGSYWPQVEAVEKRRSGVAPKRVQPQPVITPHGVYPGGYYPIKYDAGFGVSAAMDAKGEMDRFMSAGRSGKAQTRHGHTKERKKSGGDRTLELDMGVGFTHLRDVIRDIALAEPVDNAYRILNHKRVSQAFMDAGRKNDLDMLNLWLKDVAQGPIVHSDALNQFARIVKNNFTLSRLALNLKTAVMQMTGVMQSAATVGKANMAKAMSDYMRRPAATSAEVMEKSPFMQKRQTTFDRDIQDFANETQLNGPLRGRVSKAAQVAAKVGFTPLTKVQFYVVDVPTWLAGYRSGLRKFDGDEDKAVAFADRMVARAQDSGAMPDRSAISRGTVSDNARQVEWIKLFTTLQGYMIAKFNRAYVAGRQGVRNVRAAESVPQKFAATADMATNLMMIYVAESLMMGLAYASLADDDDDLDFEKFAGWLGKEALGTVFGAFPIVRDGWSAATNPAASGGGVYGSVTEVPAKLIEQAMQGENDKALRRAVADTVGLITGLPSTALMRPIEQMLNESGDRSMVEALMGRNPLGGD